MEIRFGMGVPMNQKYTPSSRFGKGLGNLESLPHSRVGFTAASERKRPIAKQPTMDSHHARVFASMTNNVEPRLCETSKAQRGQPRVPPLVHLCPAERPDSAFPHHPPKNPSCHPN